MRAWLCGLALAVVSLTSGAAVTAPATQGWSVTLPYDPILTGSGGTVPEACASLQSTFPAFAAKGYPTWANKTAVQYGPGSPYCNVSGTGVFEVFAAYSCSPNWTLSGSTCTASQAEEARVKAWELSMLAGLGGGWVSTPGPGLTFCHAGFEMSADFGYPPKPGSPGLMVQGPFRTEGVPCSADTAAVPAPLTPASAAASSIAQTCAGFTGLVNGVETCVPTVPPSGLKVEGTISKSESDGTTSKQTTGTVTCEQGRCNVTTTTTTTTGGSSSSVTNVSGESQAGYCEKNPKAGICKGLAADPCAADPTTVGCAKLDKVADGPALGKTTKVVSIVADTFAGTASCPSGPGFSVRGTSYALSYTELCNKLDAIKVFFLALSALMAAWILADSFRV